MNDDELDQSLRQLAPPPLDDLKAERVRRSAQAVLAEERRLMGRPVQRRVARAWRTAEPLLLAAVCLAYLAWAVDFAGKLYQ